jgi:competence protein ComEC
MYKKLLLGIFVYTVFVIRIISYEGVHVSQIPTDWFDKKITVTGIVSQDPNRGLANTSLPLTPLLQGEGNGTVNSKILIKLQNGTDVSYGDKVSVIGIIKHPENFMTDTGREFDYVNYLKVHDIYGIMNVSQIEIVSQHNKSIFIEWLFRVKKQFVHTIKILFPKSEAGLLAGIIVGEKSLLPKEVLSDFQIAGLTHMIVLSGYNITIVTTVLVTFLAYLGFGYRARRVGAMIIIPVFLVMTGLGASSVRAGVMSILVLLLQVATRPAHNFRIILYAASGMVFVNPRIFLHDPGFHMSFIAFIGLVHVTPIFEKIFKRSSFIIETLAVQIFMMPYILWMSGRVSFLLLVANIVTVPLIPFVMGLGFGVTTIGSVIYSLGSLVEVPVRWGLSYIIWIAHLVASVEVATFTIPPFGAWIMLVSYGVMIGVLVRNATIKSSSVM